MEAKLFKDLKKILSGSIDSGGAAAVGSPLSKTILKHANKAQAKKLGDEFEFLYSVSKAGKVSARRKPTSGTPAQLSQLEGGDVRKKVGITLGGYGHEAGAKQAAQQFMHPNVFQYQSALFPDPRTHGVKAKVDVSKPITLGEGANPLYPWGVRLELVVEGAEEKVGGWITQFSNQIRVHSTS